MKQMKLMSSIAIIMVAIFSFSIIAPASAQSISVLGEVRTHGKAFIASASGQWQAAPATYPLLQNTGIKTDDGSAALYFKDGSRIDISKDSLAVIDGSSSHYAVQLSTGIAAFNIAPNTSVSLQTPSALVSINKKGSLVQKVSLETSGRVLGVISSTDKGTEVRCISGRISIDVTPTETKLISSGESLFVDAASKYKVYNTQAVGPMVGGAGGAGVGGGLGLTTGHYIAGGLFISGAGVMVYQAQRKSTVASPATP